MSFTYVTSSVVFNTGDEGKMAAAKDFVKFYSTDPELVKASKNTLPVRESVSKKYHQNYHILKPTIKILIMLSTFLTIRQVMQS